MVLRVREFEHRFGDRLVLDRVSIDIDAGSVFGLLGPNGSGKSTLLRAICGLLRATSGSLELRGRRVPWGGREIRAEIGVVFQDASLDDRLGVRENLELMLSLHGVRRGDAHRRATELLELVGLRDREKEPARTLSGGMRRSLEIARALAHRPAILLLDEPTSGLDESAYKRVWEHLHELRAKQDLTVVLTTHRPDEAERCDQIVVLHRGRVRERGTPAALKSKVSGDVVMLEGDNPQVIADALRERLGLASRVVAKHIFVEASEGHTLIPRIVEALPPGALRSVSMHKPSLADVFLLATGDMLAADRGEAA